MEIQQQDAVFDKSSTKSVHFSEEDNIAIPVQVSFKQQMEALKSKSRRRIRTSSSGSKDESETGNEQQMRAIAPSKLRKLGEKDRHVSRSGKGRGKPKKGTYCTCMFTCIGY